MATTMDIGTPAARFIDVQETNEQHAASHDVPNDRDETNHQRSVFPFMELPKELRLQIYSYLATATYKPIDTVRPKRLPYWTVSVYPVSLLVCRTIVEEAMDETSDYKKPVTVFCRPNQHQKYCMLRAAIQYGYEMDLAQRSENHMHPLVIDPDVVEAAVQLFVQKIPFGPKRNIARLAERLASLRHFFAQTLIRLRRMEFPEMHLTVTVRLRSYKRFYNWYGSETCAKALWWKNFDLTEVMTLIKKLRYAALVSGRERGSVHVRTMVTATGKREDVLFRALERWSAAELSCVERIECLSDEKMRSLVCLELPVDLFER